MTTKDDAARLSSQASESGRGGAPLVFTQSAAHRGEALALCDNDESLIAEAVAGNQEALVELLRRHGDSARLRRDRKDRGSLAIRAE